VTARDQETGLEQGVTISDSTNLTRDDMDRMIRDAQSHASEDRGRREMVEARNQLDSAAYQLERLLKELAEKVPLHEKARCERLIEEARKALGDDGLGRERCLRMSSDLEQALRMIAATAHRRRGEGTEPSRSGFGGAGADDVIDAEFSER
jgi:molecular chaperone DnaK